MLDNPESVQKSHVIQKGDFFKKVLNDILAQPRKRRSWRKTDGMIDTDQQPAMDGRASPMPPKPPTGSHPRQCRRCVIARVFGSNPTVTTTSSRLQNSSNLGWSLATRSNYLQHVGLLVCHWPTKAFGGNGCSTILLFYPCLGEKQSSFSSSCQLFLLNLGYF